MTDFKLMGMLLVDRGRGFFSRRFRGAWLILLLAIRIYRAQSRQPAYTYIGAAGHDWSGGGRNIWHGNAHGACAWNHKGKTIRAISTKSTSINNMCTCSDRNGMCVQSTHMYRKCPMGKGEFWPLWYCRHYGSPTCSTPAGCGCHCWGDGGWGCDDVLIPNSNYASTPLRGRDAT